MDTNATAFAVNGIDFIISADGIEAAHLPAHAAFGAWVFVDHGGVS
jgi:hypothetical protein